MREIRNMCGSEARLGRYEILEELGRGAMGIVYKAHDPQIERHVAIKTICNLAEDFELEEVHRTRFSVEARAAGRLSHPGIVQVFDVGEEEISQTPYIVMEYVQGISLNKMLAGGVKLPTELALRLAQEVAEALAYAHGQGVVHRDIKPSNIMVSDEGHAKITDLGVSKIDLGNGTLGGQLVGTPAYMAPEQLNNSNEVDGRSDLFSVGVLLYCMLSGHRPFQGNSSKTVAFKISHHNPVPVTAFNLELPSAVNYVLARAMAKDPTLRYQTGTEMALDLQDVRDNRKPRSWSNTSAEDTHTQATSDKGYFELLVGIADMSPVRAGGPPPAQPISIRENIGAKFFATFTRHHGVSVAAATTLTLAYLGFRLWFPMAPMASATAEPKANPAAVPSHVATSTVGPATAVTGAHPLDERVPVASGATAVKQNAPVPSTQKLTAGVQLIVEHQFNEAQVSLWIDDQPVFSDVLRGEMTKRMLVFRGLRGKKSRYLQLTPGQHRLRVRVQSVGGAYDQEESILGVFPENVTQRLQVKCNTKKLELRLG